MGRETPQKRKQQVAVFCRDRFLYQTIQTHTMTTFLPSSLHDIALENGIASLNSVEFAELMDSKDPLKHFQSEFLYPKTPEGKRPIYLCGNSLGLQPKSARHEMNAYLLKWEEQGVHGHHDNHNGRWLTFRVDWNNMLIISISRRRYVD